MEGASTSALAALFVGMGWALIKVVHYFLSRGKNGKASPEDLVSKIGELKTNIEKMNEELEEMGKQVSHLDKIHSVYDDNSVPKWYIPGELLPLTRSIHTSNEDIKDDRVYIPIKKGIMGRKFLVKVFFELDEMMPRIEEISLVYIELDYH